MRAFIAIELDKVLRDELATLQAKLKPCGADVKWAEPHNIHLTLKFLGEVPEEKIETIKKTLDTTAANNNTFNISLSGLGAFPNLNSPRVLWVGIKEGSNESVKLANEIEAQLAKLGFSNEERPFSAHLTLGRMRSPKGRERLKEIIENINKNLVTSTPLHQSPVKDITLFQSTLTPKGPIYTALHNANLKSS
jgi:2'-5' RNA ligase